MTNAQYRALYKRIMRGDRQNIAFEDACAFVERLGYHFARQMNTSHRIYKMPGIPDIINLQNDHGKAKSYQISEIRRIMIKYGLGGDFDE